MDDSCAVCAESLEWVAYGACGHREVCSTCVARLRFICEDLRCCICKSQSNSLFVTKALGDYTKTINDFSVFPVNPTEGKNGLYWYHEDTGSFFDDAEHYKHIKAMCKLSCSECDKAEEQGGNERGQRRRGKFRNIEQLKGHLFHAHKLIMCSLCLEGRKVFICEQKLYTRAQLNQHIRTGDSEVDGSESERGGFMGHPMCEFCRKPFYGDNELYTHMSTEHYTCHICQRQNPGQFEYYKNYDDLEMHFHRAHFLCEDEACLAKKFIVFSSESEMKRHNAIEHGGNMSRSKRNSALQIPTSFRYRRDSEQDDRRGRGGRGRGRGRGRGFYSDSSEDQLSMAIQFSFESANTDNTSHGPTSSAQPVSDPVESMFNEIVPQFESMGTTDSERSSRYLQALGQSSAAPLQDASFPPLATGSSQQTIRQESEGPSSNTMAARLKRRNKGTVNFLNSANAWPARNSASSSNRSGPTTNYGLLTSSNPASSSQSKPAVTNVLNSANGWPAASSASSSSSRSRSAASSSNVSSSPASSSQSRPAITNVSVSSSYANLAQARPATGNGLVSASSGSSWNVSSTSRVSHSASAPNLVERGSMDSSMADFPPVSVTLKNKLPATTNSPTVPEVAQDVHKANKSLVEMIRSALQDDEDKFAAFKDISGEYRQGVIDSWEYMSYVQQFGLTHLVLELARLCPEPRKQRELLDAYNASVRAENKREVESSNGSRSKVSKGSNKGKGKVEDANSKSKDLLADNILDTVRKLQASYKPSEEEVEVLTKDDYRRASNGKSKTSITQEQLRPNSANRKPPDSDGLKSIQSAVGSSQNPVGAADGGGGGKQKKKTPKFLRVRLGDASAAAAALNGQLDSGPEQEQKTSNSEQNSSDGIPVRGVWRNGGGQKLASLTQKGAGK